MIIKELLKDENIEKIDNYIALCEVLNMTRPEIKLNKDKSLSQKEYKNYQKIIKELKKEKPIQYILKKANFYGLDFYVDKNVLIPRPETEYLVEKTNMLIKKEIDKKEMNILDIGTGSGIIAITLKKLNPKSTVIATDISIKALKIAKKNSKIHNTSIKFIHTDFYNGIKEKFDIIISNPPYIDINDKNIETKVKKNEPHLALFAQDNGLYCYKELLKNINSIINEKHIIAFEIGKDQGNAIKKIANHYLPKDKIIIEKDYNNNDRYIFIISKQ